MIKQIADNLLNYLLPLNCCNCNNLLSSKSLLCHECWPKLNFITTPFCYKCGYPFNINLPELENMLCPKCTAKKPAYHSARSIMEYNDTSRKIIHHFKYYDKTQLAKHFVQIAISNNNHITENDMVIPIPMHRFKRLYRLYNPAQILAEEISKYTGLPTQNNVLLKHKWSKAQSTLTRKQRIQNLKGSFKINNSKLIYNKKILLVDDVITTGTTIEICSKLLKQAGASAVNVLSIARTVLH